MQRRLFGNQHAEVTDSLRRLAAMLVRQGKLGEAETIYREALATLRKLFGDSHPNTIECVQVLKALLEREGKQPEAKALAEQLPATTTQKKSESR